MPWAKSRSRRCGRGSEAAAERGCVPRRAGSAAARPHGEAAQFHPTRPAMRSRWGWSLRHSRAPSERRRSAAVSRAERDQPQRVPTERRLDFILRVGRCAAAGAGRCDTAAARPNAAGARLCSAPGGIGRSASPRRGGSISSYASGDAQPLGLVAATQPRSVRAPPERGCVPRRAGSAASEGVPGLATLARLDLTIRCESASQTASSRAAA